MCGITGICRLDETQIEKIDIEKFNNTLKHRGPDGEGYFLSDKKTLAFGHRRLAILDLSEKGAQPMSYREDRYIITYNGEVYNFIEIRRELEKCGYKFSNDTDTEVILASYDLWGINCLEHFNGMWAFAIWDKVENKLFLSRDRFGIKPLYYVYIPNKLFAFASETVAFENLVDFKKEIDVDKLSLNIDNSFSLEGMGHTIYKNIFQILPGHYILFSNKEKPKQKRWWSTLGNRQVVLSDYQEQVRQFREIFFDACKIRMRSDVPIGTALSGGLDSSSVYCTVYNLMKDREKTERTAKEWQKAFVATFPNTILDEASYAEKVVKYVDGKVEYIFPNYKFLQLELTLSALLFDSVYFTPTFIVGNIYKAMRDDNVLVSLDGHGVDEMMFGYPHLLAEVYNETKKEDSQLAEEINATYQQMLSQEGKEGRTDLLSMRPSKFKMLIKKNKYIFLFVKKIKNIFGRHSWLASRGKYIKFLGEPEIGVDKLSYYDKIRYRHFHETTLPTILRNFDRASMQNGVEVRMPFMDWRLVTYVFSLPFSSLVGNGFSKRILRDSMVGIVPEEVRLRKLKIGINAPMIEWFSDNLRQYILDQVNSYSFLTFGAWNGKMIREFVVEKTKNDVWTWDECTRLWPYINAHIIIDKK